MNRTAVPIHTNSGYQDIPKGTQSNKLHIVLGRKDTKSFLVVAKATNCTLYFKEKMKNTVKTVDKNSCAMYFLLNRRSTNAAGTYEKMREHMTFTVIIEATTNSIFFFVPIPLLSAKRHRQ